MRAFARECWKPTLLLALVAVAFHYSHATAAVPLLVALSTDIKMPTAPGGMLSDKQWNQLFGAVEQAIAEDPNHPLLVGRVDGNPVQIRPPWSPNKERWLEGVQGTGAARWEKGIANPRADFKSAALANNDGWKAGVQQAVQEDRFAKGMATVNVDEAIDTALKVGGAGYAAGAAARQEKFQRNVDAIKGKMAAVVETVRRMPAKTDADREARAVQMIRGARAAARGK